MCIPPFVNWWPLPTIKKQTQCVPLLHKGISGICSNPTIPSRTSWTLPPDSVRLNIVGGIAWKWALVFLVRLSCAISYSEAYEYAAWLVPPFHTISSAFIYCLAQKKKSSRPRLDARFGNARTSTAESPPPWRWSPTISEPRRCSPRLAPFPHGLRPNPLPPGLSLSRLPGRLPPCPRHICSDAPTMRGAPPVAEPRGGAAGAMAPPKAATHTRIYI